MFTLLWLQHQHLSWTFPWLEAADTPSFDSLGGGGAASSLLFWWMFWQVLLFPTANELHVSAKRQEMMKNVEKHTNTAAVVWLQGPGVVEPDGLHPKIDWELMSKALHLLQLHFSRMNVKKHSWCTYSEILQSFKTLIVIYCALTLNDSPNEDLGAGGKWFLKSETKYGYQSPSSKSSLNCNYGQKSLGLCPH